MCLLCWNVFLYRWSHRNIESVSLVKRVWGCMWVVLSYGILTMSTAESPHCRWHQLSWNRALTSARCQSKGVSFVLHFSSLSPLNSFRLSPQPPLGPSDPLLVRQELASPTPLFTGIFFSCAHWLPGPWWGVRGRRLQVGSPRVILTRLNCLSPHVPFLSLGYNEMCYKLSENRWLLWSQTVSKGKCGDLSCTGFW